MITKVWEFRVNAPIERVWEFYSTPSVLDVLTSPERRLASVTKDLRVSEGALHELEFRFLGLPMDWRARISEVEPPRRFVDTAEKSPFAYWRHVHEFIEEGGTTLVRDTVTYKPPFGPLGWLVNKLVIEPNLRKTWAYRERVTRQALEAS